MNALANNVIFVTENAKTIRWCNGSSLPNTSNTKDQKSGPLSHAMKYGADGLAQILVP